MIFLGDIWPGSFIPPVLGGNGIFRDQVVCINLETGLLAPDAARRELLKCHPAQLAEVARVYAAACLANNHVNDGGRLVELRRACEGLGLPVFGAGADLDEAVKPVRLRDADGSDVMLFGFGWHVIGCVTAGGRRPGTAPLDRDLILGTIRIARRENPGAKIVVWMHWGYELDVACQPAHRELALETLRAGADAIIGAHSHNVQAVEMIEGKVLAHSLGNWIMPHGSIDGSPRLSYPPDSLRQMALEIRFEEGRVLCHRFQYEPDAGRIVFVDSGPPGQQEWAYPGRPDAGMTGFDEWYDRNRRRFPGLPIFRGGDGPLNRAAKEAWIGCRHVAAQLVRRAQGRLYDRSGRPPS